jgi:hypothetical protein
VEVAGGDRDEVLDPPPGPADPLRVGAREDEGQGAGLAAPSLRRGEDADRLHLLAAHHIVRAPDPGEDPEIEEAEPLAADGPGELQGPRRDLEVGRGDPAQGRGDHAGEVDLAAALAPGLVPPRLREETLERLPEHRFVLARGQGRDALSTRLLGEDLAGHEAEPEPGRAPVDGHELPGHGRPAGQRSALASRRPHPRRSST